MTTTTTTTTTHLIEIPLNQLTLWDGNVRKTGAEAGLDELAASIAAHGLLHPLLVQKAAKGASKGRYEVVAGQRRLLALQRLAKAKTMAKTAPVSCHLRSDGHDASELSLAENVVRIAMHPADQFDAWRGLIDKGAAVAEIAARFGVAESTVRKRLALARVSPRLFALYRERVLDLEALQAFTVTDDHALQDSVWDSLPGWQRDDARAIRRALTETDVPCFDRRVRFVGLDAYEAAGGIVRRDLFDPENGGFAQDAVLLDDLTRQKLEAVAAVVKAEGWQWAEVRTAFGWEDRQALVCAPVADCPLPDAVQAEAEGLQAEHEALSETDHATGEEQDAADARMLAIETRLDDIDAMTRTWSEEVKAQAGAIISLSYDGVPEIERGLVRKEDAAALRDSGAEEPTSGDALPAAAPAKGLPASLIEELTAQKTAALRIELARSPDVALALVTHALAGSVFYHAGHGVLKAWLTRRGLRTSIKDHDACPAVLALDAERERIGDLLPGDEADLWAWCLTAARHDLLDVLAVAAAHGIDAVESKGDANRSGVEQGLALAAALGLQMADWFKPSAKGYFSRVSKAQILTDLEAARGAPNAPAWLKLKKDELAVLAERETAEKAWLPAPLR